MRQISLVTFLSPDKTRCYTLTKCNTSRVRDYVIMHESRWLTGVVFLFSFTLFILLNCSRWLWSALKLSIGCCQSQLSTVNCQLINPLWARYNLCDWRWYVTCPADIPAFADSKKMSKNKLLKSLVDLYSSPGLSQPSSYHRLFLIDPLFKTQGCSWRTRRVAMTFTITVTITTILSTSIAIATTTTAAAAYNPRTLWPTCFWHLIPIPWIATKQERYDSSCIKYLNFCHSAVLYQLNHQTCAW